MVYDDGGFPSEVFPEVDEDLHDIFVQEKLWDTDGSFFL